ncbi:MAG: PhzF family phenazine biosynthesis protein [Armatimonas sp.]
MSQTLYVVDAFTNRPFAGNPAAVCVLDSPGDADWMQQVAQEMNLSETAFLYPLAEGGYHLRWFTPGGEVKLCGHATLASAFTLWHTGVLPPDAEARFSTLSGWLTCRRTGEWIEMDFPAVTPIPCNAPAELVEALGVCLSFVGQNEMDYLVEVADAATLRSLTPNIKAIAALPVRGVIVTAASDLPQYDFLSRFFAPAFGVPEDPVTGSAHCALGPYWAEKLGKTKLAGYQASARGGVVHLEVQSERVLLRGQAVLMSRVELFA